MGSIQVFADALNISEKQLFDMMEKGTLLSKDVLPKVAKQFAKAARDGGALAEALQSVRVQQQRFFTSLQKKQNLIFKSGFGKGFANFLKDSEKALEKVNPLFIGLGKIFKVLFEVLGDMVSIYSNTVQGISEGIDFFWGFLNISESVSRSLTSTLAPALVYLLGPLGKILFIVNAVIGVFKEMYALTTKGVMADFERAIGKDLGVDLSGVLLRLGTANTNKAGMFGGAISHETENVLRKMAQDIVKYVPAAKLTAAGSDAVRNFFSGDIHVTANDPKEFSEKLQQEFSNGQAQR